MTAPHLHAVPAHATRAALFAVTSAGGTSTDEQLAAMRACAASHGWTVADEVVFIGDELFLQVNLFEALQQHRGQFDVVVIASLERPDGRPRSLLTLVASGLCGGGLHVAADHRTFTADGGEFLSAAAP
ncbi:MULTISPECIES: hypothetical protein [unclassified Modestobacter]|uniref:hypothetical protein n=1 Tax=unclassified Modestobacter TaxID=2643866 RepID=UPI0022AA5341|nr:MULTISPECIES: hypothetical protein [unclassified Modestobacter]MCZ2826035.1 hypothetical protein [Modestobacter sp. VKM Ac-2981]MCZ2852900.1 hypothetical protein [Modestobacter sp. VKM Ac-2982]